MWTVPAVPKAEHLGKTTSLKALATEYKCLSPSCLWNWAWKLGGVPLSPFFPGLDVDTLQAKFGKVIRRRRKELELGQEALADKAGLHRTHVSLLERGKRMPTLAVVKKLAKALETTMASLMSPGAPT